MKQLIGFVIHHQICWSYSKAVVALVTRSPPVRFTFLYGSDGESCTSSGLLYLFLKNFCHELIHQGVATMLPL